MIQLGIELAATISAAVTKKRFMMILRSWPARASEAQTWLVLSPIPRSGTLMQVNHKNCIHL
jgi:hypothetical protein